MQMHGHELHLPLHLDAYLHCDHIVCTLDGPIPRPGPPYTREVSFDHLYEFHEVWLSMPPPPRGPL